MSQTNHIYASIDGTNYKIANVEIKYSICKHMAEASFEADPRLYENFVPFSEIIIYHSTNEPSSLHPLFTGYIESRIRQLPSKLLIECRDKSVKAERTWFRDEIVSSGQSTNYWLNYFLNMAQLSADIYGAFSEVYATHSWSASTAIEAIENILQIDDLRMYPLPYGTIEIAPLKSSGVDFTITYYEQVDQSLSDSIIRNKVIIWGDGVMAEKSGSNPYLASGETRTVAISTGLIQTTAGCNDLAAKIYNTFQTPLNIRTFRVAGNPFITLNSYITTPLGEGAVTSLVHKIDAERFVTEVTIGEICPAFFGISLIKPEIYCSTIGHGVWKSINKGVSWVNISGSYLYNSTVPAIHHDGTWLYAIRRHNVDTEPDRADEVYYSRFGTTGYWVQIPVLTSFIIHPHKGLCTNNHNNTDPYVMYLKDLTFKDILTNSDTGDIYVVAYDEVHHKIVVLICLSKHDNALNSFNKVMVLQ